MMEVHMMSRKTVIEALKNYAAWLQENAESIIGEDVSFMPTDEPFTITFEFSLDYVPVVKVCKSQVCMQVSPFFNDFVRKEE